MKFFIAAMIAAFVFIAAPFSADASSNPFADVPSGHWAYDAVAQLAADGVVSGYPAGDLNGARLCTRYELASVVARALGKTDAGKASKTDVGILNKLVMEFKDELDALGIKADKADKSAAALEERLGGWRLSGVFIFDANFTSKGWYNKNENVNDFNNNLFALHLVKNIDENTFFFAEFRSGFFADGKGRGDQSPELDEIYVQTKLPYDIDFRVGRWLEDFERANGLYWSQYEMNSLYGSYRTDGFRFHKNFGSFDATAFIGRNARHGESFLLQMLNRGVMNEEEWVLPTSGDTSGSEYMNTVVYLQWQPNEKLKLGATLNWWDADSGKAGEYDLGMAIYGLYADAALTPAINLKGIYYWEKLDDGFTRLNEYDNRLQGIADTSPTAYKIVLDVKQEALKFTSLWLEYSTYDNSFTLNNLQHVMNWGERNLTPSVMDNMPYGRDGATKIGMVGAEQRWNDKWTTFEKYAKAAYGKEWADDAENFTIGVTYQYTPAIAFQVVYDYLDFGYGTGDPLVSHNYRFGTDHVLKFRTCVCF